MHTFIILAQKEVKDALRNKLFLLTLGLLLILTVVSIILGALQVHSEVMQYNNSVAFLKSLGKTKLPPMPNLNPLAVSKNFVNYVGIVGALMAIILGSNSIVKERKSGTLKLILTRAVFRDQLLNGKFFGNLALLAGISLLMGLLTFFVLRIISSVPLSAAEITRMGLFFVMSFLYMAFFLVLAMTLALLIPRGNKALLITVIAWLVLAFVFPQIGDTMDMDNQLPGGFFAQMGMSRDQEKQVVAKFKFYETVRNGIEEMSPTKHYERVSFALLGVKPGFEQNTPWEILKLKWLNLTGLILPDILLGFLAYSAFLRREDIYVV